MIKPLLAAVAVLAATAVPALAGSDSSYAGGCDYEAVTDPTGVAGDPNVFHGTLYALAAVYSPSSPAEPVSATVTCTLLVADGPTLTASFSGTTLVHGSEDIAFVADNALDLYLCETVDFADDTPTSHVCYAYTSDQIPPQEYYDLLDFLLAPVPGWKDLVCAAIRAAEPLIPDVWGTLIVNDDGDVYWGKYRIWLCD